MNGLQKSFLGFVILSAAFTIFTGIYMAQPWGDNYAYHNLGDYLLLLAALVFTISPYIGFVFIQRAFRGNSAAVLAWIIGCFFVSAFGLYFLYQAAFASPDAQNGLVFMFLPIYQWFGAVVVGIISFAIKKRHSNA